MMWAAVCLLFAGLLLAAPTPTWAQTPDGMVGVQSISLRADDAALNLHFKLSGSTTHELVGNLAKRVIVIKFRNARPAFADDQRTFAYNHPLIVGMAFEDVSANATWAKIKLRTSNVAFETTTSEGGDVLVLSLKPSAASVGRSLTGIRVGEHGDTSRVVMDVSALPSFSETREGRFFTVRLRDVTARLTSPGMEDDPRVVLDSVNQEGPDAVLRFRLKQGRLLVNSGVLRDPARVVLDFKPASAGVVIRQQQLPGATGPQPEEVPLKTLLDEVDNPLITANYMLAENEMKGGKLQRAAALFTRVYETIPKTRLGLRAFFRAADALFALKEREKGKNFHDIIVMYQSAIGQAENMKFETELIARANFQIGRAYQQMGFHFESNIHYQILQENFQSNPTYTPDSYYYEGWNFLEMTRYEEAIGSFNTFLSMIGNPDLEGPAYYRLADAHYNLHRFAEAKQAFDRGRKLSPQYADPYPLLIFHMGETYFENAEFALARVLYRTLLEQYPNKSYTKLVGLRLGDFLKEEGKEEEALLLYRAVIENAPVEIRLRGMMRIANLLSERPQGEDYKEALSLYDNILTEGEGLPIQEEALLRKALAMNLHGMNQEAIDALEALAERFPNSPYNRPNLVLYNIEENLKAYVDRLYHQKKFWEVAKVYTKYRDRYFTDFKYKLTLFQVARAYQALGLYDEAVALYDEMRRTDPGPLAPLMELQKASAYLERDDLEGAEGTLLRFIQNFPEDSYLTDARMLLGKVYFTGKRYEDALNAYRIISQEFNKTKDPRVGESLAEAFYELGRIQKELGRTKEALDSFVNAVENFNHPIQGASVPDFIVQAHFSVGDMHYELGQNGEALEAYERAVTLYYEHERAPWARYQMGLIYRRMGEDKKALDTFTSLVQLAEVRPGELWGDLARQNQRDLTTKLSYEKYLKQ